MAPVTDFAVADPYEYLEGLGNYVQSEAIPGAIPTANNSPQKPPLGLRTERISGSSFVAPREHSYHTWLYRVQSSLIHSDFEPLDITDGYGPPSPTCSHDHVTPNSHFWSSFPVPESAHWINGQQLIGRTGDPREKQGAAVWAFSITEDMPERHAFSSLDGETLIVPQSGALDVRTELGALLVRQNEIAVVPRGVRYRVTLPSGGRGGRSCRGYACELYQGHFHLPELGVVGSTGLANVRDFQIPKASVEEHVLSRVTASASSSSWDEDEDEEWTVVCRLLGKPWRCTQRHTPFDVVAWHGTAYPYKFDLARFCVLGNALFDEHDPSLYTVLTARNHGGEPTTAVVDVAIIPPRWMVAEDTMWLPYYHRNTMQEFSAPIVSAQSPEFPFNGATHGFKPFGAQLNGCMGTHGPAEDDFQAAKARASTPAKVQTDGISILLLETDRPLVLSEWAFKSSLRNAQSTAAKL